MKDAYQEQAQILSDGRQVLLDHCKAKWVLDLAQELPLEELDAIMHQLDVIQKAYHRGWNDCFDMWIKPLRSC